MRARATRFLLLTLSFVLAAPVGVAAQGMVPFGGIGQEGAQVPAPGVPELSLGSRFLPLQVTQGIPSLGLRVGTWAGGGLGLRYSSSGAYLGNPHELEFALKQRLLSQEAGAPVTASLLGAVNTGSYSLDGELAVSREMGPLTLLGTARLLGNADGARLPLGGFGAGARLGLLPHVALVGDVFQVVNEAAALPAWGAGVQLHLPSTPYAFTLHLANTPSSTRQGASLGTPDLRFGLDMRMVLPGWTSRPLFAAASPAEPEAPAPGNPSSQLQEPKRESRAQDGPAPESKPPATRVAQAAGPSEASRPAPAVKADPVSSVVRAPEQKAAPQPARVATSVPATRSTSSPSAKPSAQGRSVVEPKANPKATSKAPVRAAIKPAAKAAASKSQAKGTAAPARQESELWIVMIRDGQPSPTQVTLSRGSSVTWFNRDATAHAWVGSGWASGTLAAGAQYTRRFDRAGTYRYHCQLHAGEGGAITVR